MLIKTKAIVLHTLRYGEQKMIVHLLSETEGRLSVIIRLPTTQRGKLKKQLFQPMNIIEAEIDVRPKSELHHLRDVRLLSPYVSLPFHPQKMAIALFLAEFIYYSTREETLNAPLYQYIENSLRWLDACQTSVANFHLVFMMRMSRFIGFYPNIDDYRPGDFFDLRMASFTTTPPAHPDFLNPVDAAHISTLLRMNYETMHLFRMSRHDRNRIVEVLTLYYRLHVSAFPELQSLAVMKELWADGSDA